MSEFQQKVFAKAKKLNLEVVVSGKYFHIVKFGDFHVKLVDQEDLDALNENIHKILPEVNVQITPGKKVNLKDYGINGEINLFMPDIGNNYGETINNIFNGLGKYSEGHVYLKDTMDEYTTGRVINLLNCNPNIKQILVKDDLMVWNDVIPRVLYSKLIIDGYQGRDLCKAFNTDLELDGEVGKLISTIVAKVKEKSTEVTKLNASNIVVFEIMNFNKWAVKLNSITLIIESLEDLKKLAKDLSEDVQRPIPATMINYYPKGTEYHDMMNEALRDGLGYSSGYALVNNANEYFIKAPREFLMEVSKLYDLTCLNFIDINDVEKVLDSLE